MCRREWWSLTLLLWSCPCCNSTATTTATTTTTNSNKNNNNSTTPTTSVKEPCPSMPRREAAPVKKVCAEKKLHKGEFVRHFCTVSHGMLEYTLSPMKFAYMCIYVPRAAPPFSEAFLALSLLPSSTRSPLFQFALILKWQYCNKAAPPITTIKDTRSNHL